ncbi:MAG: hypothetical protein JWM95_3818 [Gemmatimonadetes bacterium]|nr:hypothetical protein [Gemmatimonadota bacterium]
MNDDIGLWQLISDAHPAGDVRFDAGFADRVMSRVAARQGDDDLTLEQAIARQTRRLLPALAAASLALTVWNWWSVRGTTESPIAAAFGLQPVTIAAALGSGVLVGGEALQ